jgi:hypothetical protein
MQDFYESNIFECPYYPNHRIQYEKFKWHNSQWLEMVTQGNDPEVDSYDDDYLPREMMLSGAIPLPCSFCFGMCHDFTFLTKRRKEGEMAYKNGIIFQLIVELQ